MDSLFAELNTDYFRNSTDPIETDEMMDYAEMTKSLHEDTDGQGELEQRAENDATVRGAEHG